MRNRLEDLEKRIRKTSIYKKMLLLFLGMMGIILIVCIGFYYQGRKLLRNEISESISTQNRNMAASLEDEQKKIQLMQYSFVDEDDVLSLILARQSRDVQRENEIIQKIQSSLLTVWRGNRLMEEVTVVVPFCGLEINTGTSRKIRPETEDALDYYQENMVKTPFFYLEKPMIVTGDRDVYYVVSQLNPSAIFSFMGNRDKNADNTGEYVLYDTAGKVLLGKGISPEEQGFLEKTLEKGIRGRVYQEQQYLLHVEKLERSVFACVRYVKGKEVFKNLNFYQMIFFLLLFVIFIGGIIFLRKTFSMIHRPLHVLMDGLGEVAKGNLDEIIHYESSDEFGYIYDSFNRMTRQLKVQIDKNYRQEILLQKSELRQLQTQISPHFLYNSFITLSNRINAEDYEFAADFSRLLGKYFMFITRNGREFISLKEELEHACIYARIQHTRFRNRFRMQLDALDERYDQVQVPRLIIQPVFENVFKYAVDRSSKEVFLHMGYLQEEDCLDIIIENSGQELEDEKLQLMKRQLEAADGEIHGMANIHQRLQLVYGGKGGIRLSRGVQGGLKVTVRVLLELPGEEGENVSTVIGG